MTSLRWLAWPSPRKLDGAPIVYAHGFIRREQAGEATLERVALCGAERPATGRIIRPALASSAYERCHFCDQACRDMGAPHPKHSEELKNSMLYEPVHLFEEWASL